jgi:hypothetical protein
MERETTIAALTDVIRACEARLQAPEDQLAVLELAWLVCAKQARSRAAADPSSLAAEQASQVSQLGQMAALVKADAESAEPTRLELERHVHGVWRDLQSLRDSSKG